MSLTIQDDMADIFLNSGFEESITYTPAGGTAKSISAVVFRGSYRESGGTRKDMASPSQYDIEIIVSTHATNGITAPQVNGDKVSLLENIGDSVTRTFVVKGVINNDEGAWRLGLG